MKITANVQLSRTIDDWDFAAACEALAKQFQGLAVAAVSGGHEQLRATRHVVKDTQGEMIGLIVVSDLEYASEQ